MEPQKPADKLADPSASNPASTPLPSNRPWAPEGAPPPWAIPGAATPQPPPAQEPVPVNEAPILIPAKPAEKRWGNNRLLLFVLVALFGIVCMNNWDSIQSAYWSLRPNKTSDLFLKDSAKVNVDVSVDVNPPVALNMRARSDIYEIRRRAVLDHKELADDNYRPSEAVFGKIQDGTAWWGLQGLYYYGTGDKSNEGLSGESRFIANPFLLIGLGEPRAYRNLAVLDRENPVYPVPTKISWQSQYATVKITYNVSDHFKYLLANSYPNAEEKKLELVTYNARDFGFNYLWVDPTASMAVESLNKTGRAVALQQKVEWGHSCANSGGCNARAPYQLELMLQVQGVPARAFIKLWKEMPQNPEQSVPDAVVILDMI